MTQRFIFMLGASLLLLPFTSTAWAQSGQINCEQDLQRMNDLFSEKRAALTPAEQADAMALLNAASSKCASGDQLSTRSREANALLEKLINAPSPSQATVPPSR